MMAHAITRNGRSLVAGVESLVHTLTGWLAWVALAAAPIALRLALAVPFFRSGLTRWAGFLQLSDSTVYLFEEEFKLHIFGGEYGFPLPISWRIWLRPPKSPCPCLARPGACRALCRSGDADHDRRHPASGSRRLGEFPSAMGGDGARDHRPWSRTGFPRPADRATLSGVRRTRYDGDATQPYASAETGDRTGSARPCDP